MSKRIARGRRRTPKPQPAVQPTPGDAGSIARLLDTPHLARVVPQLAPETLHQLIRHNGLDVCAEIVALATPAQLASVLDLDLWRSARPGLDERFDVERFGEWVELLVDAGDTVAARIVAAMDEHLVVAGLSRYIRVFDLAAVVTIVEGEPAGINHRLPPHRGPECEVGGYLVHGSTADAWDAIVALLLALEAGHPDRFHAVMGECRRLSNSTPEVDGLDDLLMEPEQQVHDLTLDREDRRARQGYSTPADARAFLQMARRRRRPSQGEPTVNPLVAAYFRAVNDAVALSATPSAVPETPGTPVDVLEMLAGAGLVPQRPRALLEGTQDQPSRVALVRTLIEYVRDHDDALYAARSHELAFLANTLAAGCSIQSRSFTPQEAADAVMGICNLGLEHLNVALPATFLIDHDLVPAFELGWAVLHEDVSLFAAGQLVVALSNLECSDADIQDGLHALRIELTREREAGTPWHARKALDVIGMLDMPAWASVMGLLDECPVLPAALIATLDRRAGAVSATEFEFISTRSQLDRIREFMARFLEIVGR
jgi:Family of unknown function (DUF6178)